jgi:hypothetical protein
MAIEEGKERAMKFINENTSPS